MLKLSAPGLLVLLLILSLGTAPAARAGLPDSVLACHELALPQLDDMGSAGPSHLWTWDRKEGVVELWDETFTRVSGFAIPSSRGLDLHRDWGLVRLDAAGSDLELQRPGAETKRTIELTEDAADVVWLSENRVALAPTRAEHLVEIWDVESGQRLRTIGQAPAIHPRPGATFLRSLDLHYQAELGRLYALNSLTGELKTFTLEGELLTTAQVPAHRYPELERWREELDARLRSTGATQAPLFDVLRLVVDSEGTAWIASNCSTTRQAVELTQVSVDGKIHTQTRQLDDPSCSLNFTLRNDDLLFIPIERASANGTSKRVLSLCSKPR